MAEDDGITFTTKELLQGIDIKLDRVTEKLDSKAEQAEVRLIVEKQIADEGRISQLLQFRTDQLAESREMRADLEKLKGESIESKAIKNYKKYFWVVVCVPIIDLIVQIASRIK